MGDNMNCRSQIILTPDQQAFQVMASRRLPLKGSDRAQLLSIRQRVIVDNDFEHVLAGMPAASSQRPGH